MSDEDPLALLKDTIQTGIPSVTDMGDEGGAQDGALDGAQAGALGGAQAGAQGGALGGADQWLGRTLTSPPPLSPHYTPPSTSGADFLYLIHYLEQTRAQEDIRRRQEEEQRRKETERRHSEETARFAALLQRFSLANPQTPTTGTPPTTTTSSTPSGPPATPLPPKAIAQTPPQLKPDASFSIFREWRRRWEDYADFIDLAKLPREKQLIQLRMCLSLETQRVLEHTLQIAPSTGKTAVEVLDALEAYIKSLRNEAIRRRELLSCRQSEGESFNDYYVRLRRLAEEVDICPGNSLQCMETQLRTIILMGVRDEELIRKIISLKTPTSLQDVVTTCRSYEATKSATSAVRSPPNQLCAVSAYKQMKKKGYNERTSTPSTSTPATVCQSCARHHGSNKCPAADSTCANCGRRGHWAKSPKCPAASIKCRLCGRMGHYDKCCRSSSYAPTQLPPSGLS